MPTKPAAKRRGSQMTDAELQAQLSERFRELTALTVLLQEQEKAGVSRDEAIEWLSRLAATLFSQPAWWGMLPRSWQSRRRHKLLQKEGLFDAEEYLRLNPDVAAGGIDPLIHYLLHGLAEGRPRSF